MSRVLRSGKKLDQQPTMSAENFAELSRLVKVLAEKIDRLEAFSQSRHDEIYAKLTTLETTTNGLSAGLEGLNQELETVKQTVEKKADQAKMEQLKKKLDEMENRSKRNNIVIWNIPEGAEKDSSCLELVNKIFYKHMSLQEGIEVMRARRTNIKRRENATRGASLPRPIHVYLLRCTDKEYVLRNAASKLRDNPFQEANLYISDDVSKSVREERKKLKERHLGEFREREDVHFAYIPWSVPARIIYKVSQNWRLSTHKPRSSTPTKWTTEHERVYYCRKLNLHSI